MPMMIWPTKMGGYLLGLLFLVYILAIGYANNLLLIFCLVLVSVSLIWLFSTIAQGLELKIHLPMVHSQYASQKIDIQLGVNQEWTDIYEYTVVFSLKDGTRYQVQNIHISKHLLTGHLEGLTRGVYEWDKVILTSSAPFGLFRISRKFPIELVTYIYPELQNQFHLKTQEVHGPGSEMMSGHGSGDFFGLNQLDYQEARKISWKHYAQTGELFSKEYELNKTAQYFIKLQLPDDESLKENYLSQVATELTECHRQSIQFEFSHQGKKTSVLIEALKELSRC